MTRTMLLITVVCCWAVLPATAQKYRTADGAVSVAFVGNPYNGDQNCSSTFGMAGGLQQSGPEAEVPGHPLAVAGGPSSPELAKALAPMFSYEKSAALGIASYPADADPDGVSLRAVHTLLTGSIRGLADREKP